MVSIPGSGVARTWFGFRYQEQDQDSQYYSFNVMHINSLWKDHGLLTQVHGSFKDYAFWDFNFGQEFQQKKPNFYSRSKTIKGNVAQPIQPIFTQIGLDWLCYLAGNF